jgi:addiction module RelE/StbE family toxin
MEIKYKPSFLRDFKKLSKDIQNEAKEKIFLFEDTQNHEKLKVHKLHGKLKQFYSFSVTYNHRIVFEYETKQSVVFITIGTHELYS